MTYGADNRLSAVNQVTVSNDADGNMTGGSLIGVAAVYGFDARYRLTGVGSSSYQYDATGNRVAATNGGVVTRYLVDTNAALPRMLMETTSTGTPVAYNVYGPAGLIGRESATGVYQTYHYDLRGSTLKLADACGAVTDSYGYGPYGELASVSGSSANPFKYNGRDGAMSEGNGLCYLRARYYLPEVGRFVSRDSLLGGVEQAQTLNRFAFATGNPVVLVDPSGRSTKRTNLAITMIVSGAIIFAEGLVGSPFTFGTSLLISITAGAEIGTGIRELAASEGRTPPSELLMEAGAGLLNAALSAGNTAGICPSHPMPKSAAPHSNYVPPEQPFGDSIISTLRGWLRPNADPTTGAPKRQYVAIGIRG